MVLALRAQGLRATRRSESATSGCHTNRCARCHALQRREAVLAAGAAIFLADADASQAGILTKTRPPKIPIEEYSMLPNGLMYYDFEEGGGFGSAVEKGDNVTVHFDCLLGKVNVASSRYSALLMKNEVVPEPFSFTAGRPVGERRARKAEGGMAGGNFIGAGGPKPPPALSTSVIGMKKGGKRSVIVTPDQGYGDKGYDEVPGGATVELVIELLEVRSA